MEEKGLVFQRILLSRMKFIGDVVLTTPLIHTLRDAFPQAYLAYLGDKHAVSLLEHNPYVDEIIPFDFSQRDVLYSFRMFASLYAKKFDLAIDLFSNPRSALLTFATQARVRIGANAKGRGKLYTIRIQDDGKPKTAIEYHYQSLKPIGVEPKYWRTEIFLTDSEREAAFALLRSSGVDTSKKIVSLHPGGTWPAKLWQKEKFAALAQKLYHEGYSVVVTGGIHDTQIVEFVCSHAPARFVGLQSVRTIAAIHSHCSAAVSNDCGIMHISVAVGTPTIGIFGPGQEHIWFPYASPHVALRKHVPCNPCHLNVCNRIGNDYMECMNLLSVDEVFQTVMERLTS